MRHTRSVFFVLLGALLFSCAVPVTEMNVKNVTDGFQWSWNQKLKGMEGYYSFRVTDQLARPVADLDRNNFQFFQDNEPADIESISTATDIFMTLSLVVDTSASIKEAKVEKTVLESALRFVLAVHKKANFRYYSFSTEVQEINDLTQVVFSGRFTSLYDAIQLAAKKLVRRGEERIIIAFTDGHDNRSETTLEALIEYLTQQQITVYVIALGNVDTAALQSIASSTGGKVAFANSPEDLDKQFQLIAEQLGGIYRVTYLSPSRPGPEQRSLEFRITKDKAIAGIVSTFVVDDKKQVTAGRCADGSSFAAHSNILCCKNGFVQRPGCLTCTGKCEDQQFPYAFPGSNTCCNDLDSCVPVVAQRILDREDVTQFSLPVEAGTFRLGVSWNEENTQINAITPQSAADRSGIQVGDIVRKVDGVSVSTYVEANTRIRAAGLRCTFTIERNGQMQDIVVDLD
jgi:hypothetical protein